MSTETHLDAVKNWQKNNPGWRHVIRRKHAEKKRALIQSWKAQPCADCGVMYPPCVMDFDHIRGIKKFNIGQHINRSMPALLEEREKCDVVCSNCHRIRTALRRG